ncbi:prephenate dehydrogenase [Syntrophomonas wolfei]|uniref:prephenate dehydrogenase n=1 Tax=Syntrophomonas wolfei TaxID=863 RepID=UPI000774E531|nr:prephenate dehydrogenase [Syntrophomonas wolfei]
MQADVLIVGVGLIGGSLGLALKDSPLVNRILGSDRDTASLDKALEMGVIDQAVSLEEGARQARLVFLCTPLRFYPEIINSIKPHLKPGSIVSDVGSTKEEVCRLLAALPEGIWAIGGHPMAGAETRGVQGADRYLFENAVYALTPLPDVPSPVLDFMVELLQNTGARIRFMEATLHDQLVATVSHIPHLTAAALVSLTGGRNEKLMMAAGGFRDTTRIASSNPELWEDILFSNREQIVPQLEQLISSLTIIKEALAGGDHDNILGLLHEAKAIRDKIPRVRRGLIPEFCDIICIVPDRPGIIGSLGQILGCEGVNIVDIEILRVREGDGGTIRLGVPRLEDAERAVIALQKQEIKAWTR